MRILPLATLLFGCTGRDTAVPATAVPAGSPTGSPAGTPAGSPTGTATTPPMPNDPRPVSLTFSGGLNATLVFDQPSCSHYPDPAFTNFRTFWRGSGHNVVLIAEVLSDFQGAGDYDSDTHNLRVKLQTEAGAAYNFDFFQVDTAQGDSAAMTVDYVGEVAWGSFSFSGMHGADGALGADPSTVPIWCETVGN